MGEPSQKRVFRHEEQVPLVNYSLKVSSCFWLPLPQWLTGTCPSRIYARVTYCSFSYLAKVGADQRISHLTCCDKGDRTQE